MVVKILQWNIKGYNNNYNELSNLIKKHKPNIISLQETHFKNNFNIPVPINFSIYKSQNSAILIHNSIQHCYIGSLDTFDTVAVKIISKTTFYLYSTYLNPSKSFNLNDLSDLFPHVSHPIVITGDMNSWHPLWGSSSSNSRGKILSKFITQSNLVILNDGSPTHFSTHKTFTNIDLTLTSSDLSIQSEWQIEKDLYSSDHYPIITTMFSENYSLNNVRTKPLFNTKKANWLQFQSLTDKYCSERITSININKETSNIQKIILKAANESMPHYPIKHKQSFVPWWNKKLEELKRLRNHLLNIFRKNITDDNLINYRKTNALYKKELKKAKKESIEKFTSEINNSNPPEHIWSNIRRFCGMNPKTPIHCIYNNDSDNMISNPVDIANTFCVYWSHLSDDSNFPYLFQSSKQCYLQGPKHLVPNKTASNIENDISYTEFITSLKKTQG